MLQIITGKFYDSDDRFHNDCKGILYSNISFSGIQEMGILKFNRLRPVVIYPQMSFRMTISCKNHMVI